MSKLRIASQNIGGLTNFKGPQIIQSIESNKLDLAVLTEFSVNSTTNPRNQLGNKKCIFYSRNESRNNGIAFIIRKNLSKSIISMDTYCELEGYMCSVSLSIGDTIITITGVYSPSGTTKEENEMRMKILNKISQLSNQSPHPHIFIGDFNAALNRNGRNGGHWYAKDNQFQSWILESSLEIISDPIAKTCKNKANGAESAIDHVLGSNIQHLDKIKCNIMDIIKFPEETDHHGWCVEFETLIYPEVTHNKYTPIQIIKSNEFPKSADELALEFEKKNTTQQSTPFHHEGVTEKAKTLLYLRERLYMERTVGLDNSIGLKLQENKKELIKELRNGRRESFNKWLEGVNLSNNMWKWTETNREEKRIKSLIIGGHKVGDPIKLAEHVGAFYEKLYNKGHSTNINSYKRKQLNPFDSSILIRPATLEEVNTTLTRMSKTSTTGFDGMNVTDIQKMVAAKPNEMLTIINNELRNGPGKEMKRAILVTLFKKGDRNDLSNYRPIMITPMLYRLVMRIVSNRLMQLILDKSIIPNNQQGFLRNRSTMNNLYFLKEMIDKAVSEQEDLFVTLIDITKAYDNVNHKSLLKILEAIGFEESFIEWTRVWTQERSFSAKIHNVIGKRFQCSNGVPQGCPLSPLMFNLYLVYVMNENDLEDSEVNMLLFADDMMSASNRFHKVQIHNTLLEKKLNDINLDISGSKTEYAGGEWKDHSYKCSSKKMKIGGQTIASMKEIKYLGITFDIDRNFEIHSKLIEKKVIGSLQNLRTKFLYPKSVRNVYSGKIIGSLVYSGQIGALTRKTLDILKVKSAIFSRNALQLSKFSSKSFIYAKEEDGGLGFKIPEAVVDRMTVIHGVNTLNSKYEKLRELARRNMRDSEIKSTLKSVNKLYKLSIFIKDGEWTVLLPDGRELFITNGYNLERNGKESNDLAMLGDWMDRIAYDRLTVTKDDAIFRSKDKCYPSSLLIPKGVTPFQVRLMIQARAGAMMNRFSHPSYCYGCQKENATIKHTIYECPKLDQLKHDLITIISQSFNSRIYLAWEDEFVDQTGILQISPRGTVNKTFGELLNKKMLTALQRVCGEYLYAIEMQSDYQKSLKRKRLESIGSTDPVE